MRAVRRSAYEPLTPVPESTSPPGVRPAAMSSGPRAAGDPMDTLNLRTVVLIGAFGASAGVAGAQAITGFTGGSAFDIFYTASTGDAVGWNFTLNQDVIVTDVGVWIDQGFFGNPGVNSTHEWGVWDSSGSLLASGTTALGGTTIGGFEYTDVADFLLAAGDTYTIAAVYVAGDGDEYISSASGVTNSPDVNWLNSVYPTTGDLGLTFPGLSSAVSSGGRFGPNFLYTPVPTPASAALLAAGVLVAVRRRR